MGIGRVPQQDAERRLSLLRRASPLLNLVVPLGEVVSTCAYPIPATRRNDVVLRAMLIDALCLTLSSYTSVTKMDPLSDPTVPESRHCPRPV